MCFCKAWGARMEILCACVCPERFISWSKLLLSIFSEFSLFIEGLTTVSSRYICVLGNIISLGNRQTTVKRIFDVYFCIFFFVLLLLSSALGYLQPSSACLWPRDGFSFMSFPCRDLHHWAKTTLPWVSLAIPLLVTNHSAPWKCYQLCYMEKMHRAGPQKWNVFPKVNKKNCLEYFTGYFKFTSYKVFQILFRSPGI